MIQDMQVTNTTTAIKPRFALDLNIAKINSLMEYRNLTTTRLAELVGFDRKLVGRVLNGEEHASDKLIAAISARFGISVHELIAEKPVRR